MSSDEARVEKLFRLRRRLEAELIRFGRSPEDARDLTQDAFIATWKKLPHIQAGAEWAYLRATGFRRAINDATRRKTGEPLDEKRADETRSPEIALIAKEESALFRERFRSVFVELPERTRKILALRRQGHGYTEIARMLGVPMTTVQSALHRATKRFRARIGTVPAGIAWTELTGGNDDHE
jgi:RNA polymerase sigma factor (sigma-70 family)